ncbi:MAG TPA: polysaccharide deacetylase family protein [Vicinamibacterales bacterium]|nr:polysaccharide deacetylase family protein [Vicinamibacterales bacterium]
MTTGVPFEERGGKLRGVIDLAAGRYPAFLLGGPTGDLLPVFHFHEVARADLDAKLNFLAENGYRTVTSSEIAAHARRETVLKGRFVGLCFDDAWASLWTVAAPLLRRYGMRAIAYAIPSRIVDAADCRPTLDDEGRPAAEGSPFVTWPELRRLSVSGVIDVQCHTDTHSMVFSSSDARGFVTPDYASTPLLNRPQLVPRPALRFLTASELGAPLYAARSRMSDGLRAMVPLDVHEQCLKLVAREGGPAFFSRGDWRAALRRVANEAKTRTPFESEPEQRREIEEELDRGRATLNERLAIRSVNHICLPWGVSGRHTVEALERLGYRSAFANRLRGALGVRPGDHPYWLKRLPNRYLFALPGRGRRLWR